MFESKLMELNICKVGFTSLGEIIIRILQQIKYKKYEKQIQWKEMSDKE